MNKPFFDSGFEDADEYADVKGLITSLDIQNQHAAFKPIHDLFCQALQIDKGNLMLEVGCGTGYCARRMAEVTHQQGVVIAVDKSHHLLNEAVSRTDFTQHRIEFRQGDVMELAFEDDTFVFAHAERVLMHVPNPFKALEEMVRVLKKNGEIVIAEPDLLSAKILPDPDGIGQKMIDSWCSFTNAPDIGYQLLAHFHALPVKDIRVCVNPILISSYQEINTMRSFDKLLDAVVANDNVPVKKATEYRNLLLEANAQGKFMYYVNMYTVFATKI